MPEESMQEEQGQGARPGMRVGFIGLGDQGLPMAVAMAEAGHELHVWARRRASLAALDDVPHHPYADLASFAAAVDVIGICISRDEDVLRLADDLLPAMRPDAVLVNHGTGTPANARLLARAGSRVGVHVLDAPVSGGRPAAESRTLTVLAGGDAEALTRVRPVLDSFAAHVVHVGEAGAGQMAKLFNNALLMLNQASIADVLRLAGPVGIDPALLVDALRLGSASSRALELTNTMVNPDTVEHLSEVEGLDMRIFDEAMRQAGVEAAAVTARGLEGAQGLPEVIGRLNP